MISLSLWIYGKPEWELDLDEDIDPSSFDLMELEDEEELEQF